MRQGNTGWRARGGAALAGTATRPEIVPAAPRPATPPRARGGLARRSYEAAAAAAAAAQRFVTGAVDDGFVEPKPWAGVNVTITLVAFFAYVFVVMSQKLPIGQAAMVVALVTLPMRKQPITIPLWVGLFVAYIGVGVLSYAGSRFPNVVFPAVEDRAKVLLITIVAVNLMRTRRDYRLWTFLYLGLFALYPARGAIYNYFIAHATENGRLAWNFVFANPNDLAAFCFLPFGLALGVLATEPKKNWTFRAALAGSLVLPLIIVLTQSRGGMLGLSVFLIIMFIRSKRRMRNLGAAILIGAVVVAIAPKSAWQRFGKLSNVSLSNDMKEVDEEGSAESRWNIWKVAISLSKKNPVTGVGMGAYQYAHLVESRLLPDIPTIARGARDTHSTYLNVLAETGIIGLALILSMIAIVFVQTENARRFVVPILPKHATQIMWMECSLAAFCVSLTFSTLVGIPLFYFHLAAVWCSGQSARAHAQALLGGGPRGAPRPGLPAGA